MICIEHRLHDHSQTTTGCLLCLILFCSSVAAQAQSHAVISGFGAATVDGIKQAGEWATAGRLVFDARMDQQGTDRKAFAILYAMNDETHLFLGLVTETGLLDSSWLWLLLSDGSKTTEFYFSKRTGQLLQEVPGASPERLFETPDCCRAKVGGSQGYDMLEFEYSQARADRKDGLALTPGKAIKLQMSLVFCTNLPGKDACWNSAHDAFSSDSGKFEIGIELNTNRDE